MNREPKTKQEQTCPLVEKSCTVPQSGGTARTPMTLGDCLPMSLVQSSNMVSVPYPSWLQSLILKRETPTLVSLNDVDRTRSGLDYHRKFPETVECKL